MTRSVVIWAATAASVLVVFASLPARAADADSNQLQGKYDTPDAMGVSSSSKAAQPAGKPPQPGKKPAQNTNKQTGQPKSPTVQQKSAPSPPKSVTAQSKTVAAQPKPAATPQAKNAAPAQPPAKRDQGTQRPGGGRSRCLSQADTRETVAARKLFSPFTALRAAGTHARGETIGVRLCRHADDLFYEVNVLRRDGRVVKVILDAANGKILRSLNDR